MKADKTLSLKFIRNLFKLVQECNIWIITDGIQNRQIKQISKKIEISENIVFLGLAEKEANVGFIV